MFTGIIAEMGEVVSLTPTGAGSSVLTIRAGAVLDGLPEGGSLAVNGVCLTQEPEAASRATAASESQRRGTDAAPTSSPASPSSPSSPASRSLFVAHVMGETLTRTTVGELQPGDPVNLERCPQAGDRFDGHIVQGHVDGTGHVVERVDEGDWVRIRIGIPADLAPFTAEKGSIALDGVSLTLTAVSPATGADHWLEVGLIPATLAATRMGVLQVGDTVNVEVDIIAKYAARLTAFQSTAAARGTFSAADPETTTASTATPPPPTTTTTASAATSTATSTPAPAPATASHEGDLS